jgi:EmrB/QacA subfamily drug resistance transporter
VNAGDPPAPGSGAAAVYAEDAAPALDAGLRRATIVMIVLSSVATAVMLSAVNVALPAIAHDLGIDAVTLSWIPMAYLMASAACVLAAGRLADLHGRKRVFLLGTAWVVVASVLAALADNTTLLLTGRLLQGVGAAMLFATQIAIISSVFPPARRGAAIGYAISAIYLGLALGPALGGWLIGPWSWRATFLLHVPLSLAALWIGLRHLPMEWRSEERGRFDVAGALIYGVAIVVLMLGLTHLPGVPGSAMLIAGAAGLWAFFRHAHGHPHPIFDVELFYTNRVFTLSCLAALFMYTSTFANVVLVSLYLQYLKGVTPATAGLVMMAQPVVMAAFSPLAGRLSDSVEPRLLASLGMALTALALGGLAALDAASPLVAAIACLLLTGFGFSLFSSPNANAIMSAVARGAYSQASGAMSLMRVLGQLTSMGLVALVFAVLLGPVAITPAVHGGLARAISLCFMLGAGLCVLGMLLSLARGEVHGRAA